MTSEPIKYQMCRMLLINAGTNQHVPSGRITEIDPRGGAAVLGDNGVGKTTTLRILPLFFGHLPSQIVASGQGQEAMIRFILPTDSSAIAFEYQRGSESESDLRLAVIRRRPDEPDVPFYRLYRCGFRQELFVKDGRLLSDEETQSRATELGIQTTSKLNTSEYRSVILRTLAMSKERDRLRRYSLEWSYGPKQLDNLDRVVAAMVKKHISFADIVQVAVGLVQNDMGQGGEKSKLTFKQGRGPIERWLRNRDACLDAFKRAGEFAELEDDLRDHRATEARYRACRADVSVLKLAREKDTAAVNQILTELATSRTKQVQAEFHRKTELAQAAATASQAASSSKIALEEAVAQKLYFDNEKAEHWNQQILELPALRASLRTTQEQIEAAEAKNQEATVRYAKLENDAKTRAADQCLAYEKSKEPERVRLANTILQVNAAEAEALRLCEQEVAARRQKLDDDKEPLLEQRGTWEGLKKNLSSSKEAQQGLEEANQRLLKHVEDASTVSALADRMKSEWERETREFKAQEAEVAKARAELLSAQNNLAMAQARLNPPAGSFLASLRASADDSWKRDLAKVINPLLLSRQDLDPMILDDDAQTVYGWRVNTGVIPLPSWADDSLARTAIEEAQQRLAIMESRLPQELEALEVKGRKVHEAELTVQTTQARASVLNAQTAERKAQAEAASQRVKTEEREASSKADAQLAQINTALTGLQQQRRSLDAEHTKAITAVRAGHDKQRADAQLLCNQALKLIDARIDQVQSELPETLKQIAAQLHEHLTKEGVDINRLTALKAEDKRLRGEVQIREERTPLVDRWKKWVAEGGPTSIETLRAAAQRAATASAETSQQFAQHLQAIQASEMEYQGVASGHEKRLSKIADDLETLRELDDSFGDYLASGESAIDPSTPARDLKAKARGIRTEMERLEFSITKRSSSLRQALTTKNSTVKDLVDATLGPAESGTLFERASALCSCYKLIGPQVATDVNMTLRTILANIGAFQKVFQSFESEVSAFNGRLQAGLSEVKCFERVKDLRLDIVTNFDGLGFYKKLARMEDVVRKHANEPGKDYTRDLPPDETARALSEFMSVLGSDGNLEVNLSGHITLRGSVNDNGTRKEFKRSSELENISSEGLTSLILITLMTALLNTIRGSEPVHVPWVTDEVGKFDPKNFRALMQRLHDNLIDVVTASPELGPTQQAMFARRYMFEDKGKIYRYRRSEANSAPESSAEAVEQLP